MQFVNIYDAKTNFSKYLEYVQNNHETIIICRNGIPVGQLTEYKPQNVKTLGILKGKMHLSDNFEEELPDSILGDYR